MVIVTHLNTTPQAALENRDADWQMVCAGCEGQCVCGVQRVMRV